MPPKKKADVEATPRSEVPEEPVEPPPPVEGDEIELETGLKLPLRPNDVEKIWALHGDCDAQTKLLIQLLGLEQVLSSAARRDIIADFYLFNLSHAKSLCLTKRQAAVFHSIMSSILDMLAGCPGRPKNDPMLSKGPSASVTACFQEYERLLLMHALNDPPSRLGIFRGSDAKMLTDYVSNTFFKHFLLYQFVTKQERDVQTLRFSLELDRPAPPPNLAFGRLKPGSKRLPEADANGEESGTAGVQDENGPQDQPEEDEIQKIVEEKLRETEAKLQAKLEERERLFAERLKGKS